MENNLKDNKVKFISLNPSCKITIYDIIGNEIKILNENDFGNAGFIYWDVKDKNGNVVPRGVYMCVVEDDLGNRTRKKISIIK